MPLPTFDPTSIQPLAQQAYQSASSAIASEKQASTLPDMLKDTLMKKFTNTAENPLYGQRDTARTNFLSAGAAGTYTPNTLDGQVYSPEQINQLRAKDRATAVTPLASLNEIIQANYGGINNTIDSSARAFGANATAARGQAGLDQQKYGDAFQNAMAIYNSQVESQKFDEQTRQFNETLSESKRARAASGGGGSNLASLISSILGGSQPKAQEQPAFKLNTDEFWSDLVKDSGGDQDKIWSTIDQFDSQLRASGIDVDELWRRHSVLAGSQSVTPTSPTQAPGLGNLNADFSGLQGLSGR